jgi:hypothetical protein
MSNYSIFSFYEVIVNSNYLHYVIVSIFSLILLVHIAYFSYPYTLVVLGEHSIVFVSMLHISLILEAPLMVNSLYFYMYPHLIDVNSLCIFSYLYLFSSILLVYFIRTIYIILLIIFLLYINLQQ